MTGNGIGELWAFFAWADTPKVAQLDKGTGDELVTYYITEMESEASAFAFAYWGGDFYLFHGPSGESTTVYRLHDGALEEWIPLLHDGLPDRGGRGVDVRADRHRVN